MQSNVLRARCKRLMSSSLTLKTICKVCSHDTASETIAFRYYGNNTNYNLTTETRHKIKIRNKPQPNEIKFKGFLGAAATTNYFIGQVSFKPPKQEGEQRQKQPHPHHPPQVPIDYNLPFCFERIQAYQYKLEYRVVLHP